MSTTFGGGDDESNQGAAGGQFGGGSAGIEVYFHQEKELVSYFNKKLTTSERIQVLLSSFAPLLLLSLGYLVASFGLNSLVGIAWAQPVKVFGLNHHEWSMAVYLTYNAVIIVILVMLIITIVKGSRSQWAWRTASFLLGFLVKSISVVPTF